jgi:outer membrane protein assembly factor BamE (lipoprotein component of BamABCDE complex)
MQKSSPRFFSLSIAAAGMAVFLSGCSPEVEHRGYVPKPGAFSQITNGMTKLEVEGILGTPSTSASVQYKGDSYYYITSITTSQAFMREESQREVIAIRFDEDMRVRSFAQYGLQDGRVINVNTRQSAVVGEDTSLITALLRSSKGTQAGPMLGGKL